MCSWVCGSGMSQGILEGEDSDDFLSVLAAPFKFSEEGKFDLRRLEKWWWDVLGCGSLLGGRGGGGLGCMSNMLLEDGDLKL